MTLIILEKAAQEAVGLVILFEVPVEGNEPMVHVRLGYLFGAKRCRARRATTR